MYTVRLAIRTSPYDERYLNKCFYNGWQISNQIRRRVITSLGLLTSMKDYQIARRQYGKKFTGKDVGKLSKEEKQEQARLIAYMKKCQKRVPISKSELEHYAIVGRQQYSHYMSAHQAQWIAVQVYNSVQKYLYSDGKQIHFKRMVQFDTIGQKCATNGVVMQGWYRMRMNKKIFRLQVPDTSYMHAVMEKNDRIVTVSLKRIEFNSGWKYYVILTLDGNPPVMHSKAENNTVGIDLGTSTVAAESSSGVMLENLAPDASRYEKQIRHLQALIDHKLRAANPDNYDTTGKVRKGRHFWKISKAVRRMRRYVRVLYRQQTACTRTSHRTQINRILSHASAVVIEPMSFRPLQKKAKQTERSDKVSEIKKSDGTVILVRKYKRKKRYGHSIKNRSPGFFQSELKRKAGLMKVPVIAIDAKRYKASQLHHDTGEYIPAGLNERYKTIADHQVQRDLYSAFLIRHTDTSLCRPDFEKCATDFQHFVALQNALLSEMRASHISNIPCWGF